MRLPLPIDMVPSLLVLLFIEHATTQVKCSPALSISSQGRMSEATAAAGGLQALFSKPRKLYVSLKLISFILASIISTVPVLSRKTLVVVLYKSVLHLLTWCTYDPVVTVSSEGPPNLQNVL